MAVERSEQNVLVFALQSTANLNVVLSEGIDNTYFADAMRHLIFLLVANYYIRYKTIPSADTIASEAEKHPSIDSDNVPRIRQEYEKLQTIAKTTAVLEIAGDLDELRYTRKARRFSQIMKKLSEEMDASDIEDTVRTLLDDLETLQSEHDKRDVRTRSINDEDWIAERIDRYIIMSQDPTMGGGIQTGIHEIDTAIGALRPGELMVLVGRHGCGKSALANVIGTNAYADGHNVMFAGLEMSQALNALRFDSLFASVPYMGLRDGTLSEEDVERYRESLTQTLSYCKNKFYFIPQERCQTVQEIQRELHLVQNLNNCKIDLVVIDYLNILDSLTLRGQRLAGFEQQHILAKEARAMGAVNSVPVVTPCQANRGGVDRSRNPGTEIIALGDMIGATADYVLRLKRGDEEIQSNTMHVSFLKNRHGPQPQFYLDADLDMMYIGSHQERSAETDYAELAAQSSIIDERAEELFLRALEGFDG